MATHREVKEFLLRTKKGGQYTGHFLHYPVEKHHLFSWATTGGEMDITFHAPEASRLWVFQFYLGAKQQPSCKTFVNVLCPERFNLVVSGRRVPHHDVELEIYARSDYSERPSYPIVDVDPSIECEPRFKYKGHAQIGTVHHPIDGAFDLVYS